MTAYLELTASWLFANAKGRDAKAFPTRPPFAKHPKPTISITSPDCGPDGSTLDPAYIHGGEGRFPALEWDASSVPGVQEWLLVSEDPDAPLPTPICHGIYLGIPKDQTKVVNEDFQLETGGATRLKGGFYHGMSRNGKAYIVPRPLLNHGIHRYFYQIIALSEPLSPKLIASKPTREQVAEAIDGKILAWGQWMAKCERRWKS